MRRSIGLALILFVLAMLGPFKSHAATRCRFACVAHKVTDLKTLTLGLEAELGEAEDRLDQQTAAMEGLRGRVSALEGRNAQLATWASSFQRCLGEVPISRYGEEQGPAGYVFQYQGPLGLGSLPTTALDVTYDPDPVGAWIWVNACNRERVTPSASLVRLARGPVAPGDATRTPDSELHSSAER